MSKDAENTENEKKSDKQSSKPAVILAACILGVALLLQGGYYLRIYLSRTIEVGPFATRRYGNVHAVSADTPYVDTKIAVPEGYNRGQVYRYFKEIALMDEGRRYKDTIRKWVTPIRFYVEGETDELVEGILQELFESLNAVEGFPGITRVDSIDDANLIGYFYYNEEFITFAKGYGGGKFTYGLNYLELNESDYSVKDGFIALRMDLPQTRKTNILYEEVIQVMGLQNDSYAFPDSLFYQVPNDTKQFTPLDRALFRILYHPLIQPGMNFNQCLPILTTIVEH